MCTAISITKEYHLFGRTLDVDKAYGEEIVITPRGFEIDFLFEGAQKKHPAIMGAAYLTCGKPLYFDAVNEYGLAMAGLNFPKSARYRKRCEGFYNVASFELIPWVLAKCKSIFEAKELLNKSNVTENSFSDTLPATPMHWIVSDKSGSLTVEPRENGLSVCENPFGVLTNDPPFSYHASRICDFISLGAHVPQNRMCPEVETELYSYGMGAVGLPGDFSSSSRFVRAVYAKNHTDMGSSEADCVSAFFHVMDTVSQPRGTVVTERKTRPMTMYTSCINTDTLTYYFTTYNCRRIRAVAMPTFLLNASSPIAYPMTCEEDVLYLD